MKNYMRTRGYRSILSERLEAHIYAICLATGAGLYKSLTLIFTHWFSLEPEYIVAAGFLGALLDVSRNAREAKISYKNFLDVVSELSSVAERLDDKSYVSPSMKAYHDELTNWHADTVNGDGIKSLNSDLWKKTINSYLNSEVKSIEAKNLYTTSHEYTNAITEISKSLENSSEINNKMDKSVHRIQFTGMLPEEVFNAPQIAHTKFESKPVFVCHRWENYKNLYGKEYSNSSIIRYVFVKSDESSDPTFSAFSTYSDLLEQSRLSINVPPKPRRFSVQLDDEDIDVKRRLLRMLKIESDDDPSNIIRSIMTIEMDEKHGNSTNDFTYVPIKFANANEDQSSPRYDWQNLLCFFAKEYHNKKERNAKYCVIDSMCTNNISHDARLRKCFRSGWLPEITFFHRSKKAELISNNPDDWLCGILGYWKPYTSDMRMSFLTGVQARDLYFKFRNEILDASRISGNLMDLNKHI